MAIVDTSPLVAVADEDNRDHTRCLAVLQRSDLRLVVPALVICEATYLIGVRAGPRVEAAFLRGMSQFDIECPQPEDWKRIGELVERYADFPLGGTDASVIALAERLNTAVVITLDRRHFSAVRARHVPSLRLLPED